MNHMKSKLLAVILVLGSICITNSCSEKKNDAASVEKSMTLVPVTIKDVKTFYGFYDIVSDVKFLPLETTDSSLIGSIGKIKFFEHYILVFDGSTRSIFIFDDKGKYVNKINRVGRGPYEYNRIKDFCVHPVTGDISVLTDENKILVFSFDLKKCTSCKNNQIKACAIERFRNGNYAFASSLYDANVYVTDSNMNILKKGLPNPIPNSGVNLSSFSKFGDTVLCRVPTYYNDTIYRITEDSFVPWFAPSFEDHMDYSNLKNTFANSSPFSNQEMSLAGSFFETNEFILFSMTYPKHTGSPSLNQVLFSKKNKCVKYFSWSGKITVTAPFSMGLDFFSRGEHDGMMVSYLTAPDIIDCQILKEDSITSRIKALQSQLIDESNPVLTFIKFKE